MTNLLLCEKEHGCWNVILFYYYFFLCVPSFRVRIWGKCPTSFCNLYIYINKVQQCRSNTPCFLYLIYSSCYHIGYDPALSSPLLSLATSIIITTTLDYRSPLSTSSFTVIQCCSLGKGHVKVHLKGYDEVTRPINHPRIIKGQSTCIRFLAHVLHMPPSHCRNHLAISPSGSSSAIFVELQGDVPIWVTCQNHLATCVVL